jgi:hypothetical protein
MLDVLELCDAAAPLLVARAASAAVEATVWAVDELGVCCAEGATGGVGLAAPVEGAPVEPEPPATAVPDVRGSCAV